MKTCTKCQATKPINGFYKRSRSPDGHEAMCKECRLAHNRRWLAKNKDRHHELTRSWYAKNREQHLANSKAYYEANKENYLEYFYARQERTKRATPPWVDRKEIRAFYAKAQRLSAETGVQYDVDHIVPLRGKTVCGLHVPWNLQVMPSSDNKRKATKLMEVICGTV
jgi:hypothetical protein